MIKIFVWKKSEQSEMGHASMLVRADNWSRKFYVSWYPASEVGFAYVWGVEKCVRGKKYNSLANEIKTSWKGVKPDLSVSLRGLNEDKIKQAWDSLVKKNQWCLGSKNCATIVYMLLRAGGARSRAVVEKYGADYDKEHSDWNPFTDDRIPGTLDDHLAGKLARMAKNAWTPIRLYNYAIGLSHMQQHKRKRLKRK